MTKLENLGSFLCQTCCRYYITVYNVWFDYYVSGNNLKRIIAPYYYASRIRKRECESCWKSRDK